MNISVGLASSVVAAATNGQKAAEALVEQKAFWTAVSQAEATEHQHVNASGAVPAKAKVVKTLLGGIVK